ncbi:MAG: hypothetical protein F6K55_27645 [Moorea sp. SIO4A3]|nr:hypothetical protein [Moorena sp. SIO4A3]
MRWARGKRQKARGKRQEARGKRQEAIGVRDPKFYCAIKKDHTGLHLKYKCVRVAWPTVNRIWILCYAYYFFATLWVLSIMPNGRSFILLDLPELIHAHFKP